MRQLTLPVAAIALLVIAATGGRLAWLFLAQDNCLDSGGAWDANAASCIRQEKE